MMGPHMISMNRDNDFANTKQNCIDIECDACVGNYAMPEPLWTRLNKSELSLHNDSI